MKSSSRKRASRRSVWTGLSALLLVVLLTTWWIGLTLLFSLVFENYLDRVTHPFSSGFNKGPWGFLFLYAILSLPLLRVHSWLMRWIEAGSARGSRP